jgi:hypothetical protein
VRLEAACRPVFARHETFHPRYGWVKKAYDATACDADVFNRDDAVVELGVGKNMVRSIRFWGLAFKVLSNVALPGSRTHLAQPSTYGDVLFADDGWDPYCELPGTLWLLHWSLLKPPSVVPVWWLAYNEFSAIEFTAEDLEQFILDRIRDWNPPHASAVRKDVLCLLRMYAAGQTSRATFDDLIDCPFRELGLLQPSLTNSGAFRFLIGPKPTLPPAIAAFACLDFVSRTDSSASVVSVNRLVSEHGSPGRAFKLTETELSELLQRAARESPEIELTSAAGVVQLAFDDDPSALATEVLRDHYQRLTGSAQFHGARRVAGTSADQPHGRPIPLELQVQT